jgi:hypothetical protein
LTLRQTHFAKSCAQHLFWFGLVPLLAPSENLCCVAALECFDCPCFDLDVNNGRTAMNELEAVVRRDDGPGSGYLWLQTPMASRVLRELPLNIYYVTA